MDILGLLLAVISVRM